MNNRKYAFSLDPDIVNHKDYYWILKKKQANRRKTLQEIDRIIKNKEQLLSGSISEKNVCLIGHSQLDQWNITDLAGYKVRNCGVSGITSFEYYDKILRRGLLKCDSDCYIVMHGTNDIVWDYSIYEIVESIKRTIEYIKNYNNKAHIFFVSCIHVNDRLDRNNARIDCLNSELKDELKEDVIWIDTSFLNNSNGELDKLYTNDGLHLSEAGYELFRERIELTMKRIGL